MVRDQTPLSSTCSRQEQRDCRRRISQNERPQRLEDRFDCYSAPNHGVPNRSLCVWPDTSTEQIRQLAARSGCDPCGRVHNELDKFDGVRISAIQPHSRRPSQDQEGNGNTNIDCTSMVSSAMVASVSLLIDLVINYPVYLGNNSNLLTDVSHPKTTHPLFPVLKLAVWKYQETFRNSRPFYNSYQPAHQKR